MSTTTLTRNLTLSLAGMGVALMSMVPLSGVASATSSTAEISIPVSTVVRNIGVGNSKVLVTKDIDEDAQGMTCSVKAGAENQGSVHPGNNLVITSGDSSVTLEDVERAPNVTTSANGELTLDESVAVSLVMGKDNVFSAGMDVVLSCEDVPEIEVCRDGKIITIGEDEKLETDTDVCPVPEEPKLVTVCRDGEIITINETEVLDTDLLDNCPQTLGTQTLPKTGAGAIATSMLSLTSVMAGAYGYIKSRR